MTYSFIKTFFGRVQIQTMLLSMSVEVAREGTPEQARQALLAWWLRMLCRADSVSWCMLKGRFLLLADKCSSICPFKRLVFREISEVRYRKNDHLFRIKFGNITLRLWHIFCLPIPCEYKRQNVELKSFIIKVVKNHRIVILFIVSERAFGFTPRF